MTTLNSTPGSITTAQLKALHATARQRGLDHDALHDAAGVASLKTLSTADASELLLRLGGEVLPNPPGRKPPPSRSRRRSDTVRMITPDQIEQIGRLGREYFGAEGDQATRQQGTKAEQSEPGTRNSEPDAFAGWLKKTFKVSAVRDLATAEKAGQVIAVLKGMLGQPLHTATGIRGRRQEARGKRAESGGPSL